LVGWKRAWSGEALTPAKSTSPPGLIRLSTGCENVEDLWNDLDAALAGLS